MFVSDQSGLSDVRNIHLGIADGFQVDKASFGIDGPLDGRRIGGLDQACGDAILFKNTIEKVICRHKKRVPCHKLVAGAKQGHTRVGDGCHARSHHHRTKAAF